MVYMHLLSSGLSSDNFYLLYLTSSQEVLDLPQTLLSKGDLIPTLFTRLLNSHISLTIRNPLQSQ
jgi:hypothetical protein